MTEYILLEMCTEYAMFHVATCHVILKQNFAFVQKNFFSFIKIDNNINLILKNVCIGILFVYKGINTRSMHIRRKKFHTFIRYVENLLQERVVFFPKK